MLTFSVFFFSFQERAKLAYFDYGDVICREGEMPQGIYLIISGMAIVRNYLFFTENIFEICDHNIRRNLGTKKVSNF